jgi:hypothetical protein
VQKAGTDDAATVAKTLRTSAPINDGFASNGVLRPDGSFVHEPAPASSFYHLVCAIGELGSLSSGYHAQQN